MSFEVALRLSEGLLAWALLLQSSEHVIGPRREKLVFGLRFLVCLCLLFGLYRGLSLATLLALNMLILIRFQGPYNGGSDRMGGLVLTCLTLVHLMPSPVWQERVFAYLALQLILSYFISGWVKLRNPQWRGGQALADVFAFSAYPVSTQLRDLAQSHALLWAASWAVISFEVLFPFALVSQTTLIAALVVGAMFHLANACLFGLNRFFWIWLSAYPALIWLQDRVIGA